MKLHLISIAILTAAAAACTPSAPSTDAATAPPATDIAAPAPATGPAEPNTADALATTPAAAEPAPAQQVTSPAAPPVQTTAPTTPSAPVASATPAEIENGRAAYTRTCAMCHGPKGEGTPAGSALVTRDAAGIANKITKGVINPGERMPAMGGMLSAEEIDDVSKFVAAGLPQ